MPTRRGKSPFLEVDGERRLDCQRVNEIFVFFFQKGLARIRIAKQTSFDRSLLPPRRPTTWTCNYPAFSFFASVRPQEPVLRPGFGPVNHDGWSMVFLLDSMS